MQILCDPTMAGPCVLVLGMFDGVHIGHQQLLSQGLALAKKDKLPLYVCTFEPHPVAVLFPDKTPPRLTTPSERAELMQQYHVDTLCVTTFTKAYAAMPPEQFVARMAQVYQPKYVVTGFNFTFGDRGRGNAQLLQALQAQYGYHTVVVPAVTCDGATVSSTRIRGLLSDGDLERALMLLGHRYSIGGTVKCMNDSDIKPIADSLEVEHGKALPKNGAYACLLTIDGQEGKQEAVACIDCEQPISPVSFCVLQGELPPHGAQVQMELLHFLRDECMVIDEQVSSTLLQQDIEAAKCYFV